MQLGEVPGDEEVDELDQHPVQLVDASLQLNQLLVLREAILQNILQGQTAVLFAHGINVHQRGVGMGDDSHWSCSFTGVVQATSTPSRLTTWTVTIP